MNELEENLQAMRLSAPSADLDRRIDDAFTAVARNRHLSRKKMIWLWLPALGACGVAAALFLVWTQSSRPSSKQITYRIEAQGRMRLLLLNPPSSANPAPRFVITTHTP